MRGPKRIWMQLDNEGYPIVTADSAAELARLTGAKLNNIESAVSHQWKRGNPEGYAGRPRKWAAVLDEEEEE